MLNSKGFDLWAGEYDKSVSLSDECDTYPFAGYKAILNEIYNRVLSGTEGTYLTLDSVQGRLLPSSTNRDVVFSGRIFPVK